MGERAYKACVTLSVVEAFMQANLGNKTGCNTNNKKPRKSGVFYYVFISN